MVPFTPSRGVNVKLPPVQMDVAIAAIAGFGKTVTVTVKVDPTQPPSAADAVGVTVYVADCDIFVVLLSVPLILEGVPLLAAPPVIPPVTTGASQLYVVPAGTTPLVPSAGATAKFPPLQIIAVIALIAGLGLTVIIRVNGVPAQLPNAPEVVGVTV